MYTYYSSFISGTHDIIKNNLCGLDVQKLMDGGILYSTDRPPKEIKKIRFFNNSFLVIQTFENLGDASPINKMIASIELEKNKHFLDYINSEIGLRTFRTFLSDKNHLISVDKNVLYRLETELEKITGLKVEPKRKVADLEFWFLYRTEKIGLFMLRITKNKKKVEKGELRPELANILSIMSNPTENDIFLDPFCGSGAIPLERSRICNFKGIFACDKNINATKNLKTKIKSIKSKKLNRSFFIKNLDFIKNNFDSCFFTTIVTDPPWGFFEKIDNLEIFYNKMLEEMHRILIKGGLIIILTANKDLLLKILDSMKSKLKLIKEYNILVSGKKAAIYKIKKL